MTEIIINLEDNNKKIAENILSKIKSLYDGTVSKLTVTSQRSKLPVWVWAGEEAPAEVRKEIPDFGYKKDHMVAALNIMTAQSTALKNKGESWTCKTYFFMYMARVFKSFFEKNDKGGNYSEIMKKTISLARKEGFNLTPKDYGLPQKPNEETTDEEFKKMEEDANWWYNFCDFYISLKPPSQEKTSQEEPNLNVLLGHIKLKTLNGDSEELKILAPEEYNKDNKPAGPRRLAFSESQKATVRKLDTNFIIDCYKEFTPFNLTAAGEGGRRRRRKRRKSRKKKSKKSKRKSRKRKTKRKRKKRKSRKRRR